MWIGDLLILYEIERMIRFVAESGLAEAFILPKPLSMDKITSQDPLAKELVILLDGEDYNTAENMLFAKSIVGNKEHLSIAMEFYQYLSRLSQEELKEGNFSLEEVQSGLIDFMERYGIHLFSETTIEEES